MSQDEPADVPLEYRRYGEVTRMGKELDTADGDMSNE